MKTHELKIWPEYFNAVADGRKTYEHRKNDRDFHYGDTVILREWDNIRDYADDLRTLKEPRGYTGKELRFKVGYILPLKDGYVVFSLLQANP